VGTNVTAAFSEPVQGFSNTTFTLKDSAGNVIPAGVTYNATTLLATLDPIAKLAADTRYTATLTGGTSAIRDMAGNGLATTAWTFLTGPKPKVTAKAPASGAIGVSRTANVTVNFNEPVIAVSDTTFTLTTVTGAVAALVSQSGTSNQWILDPIQSLAANTSYTVTVTGGPSAIRDIAGNPLVTTKWTFQTGA